jgi:DNA topoisomerase-6 subunit B
VTIVDNGPGIVRKQVENIFGRLLYGSKFHRLKMSRGQQGIGISAAGMYGLITTGTPDGDLHEAEGEQPRPITSSSR